jgi:hypothetical protein
VSEYTDIRWLLGYLHQTPEWRRLPPLTVLGRGKQRIAGHAVAKPHFQVAAPLLLAIGRRCFGAAAFGHFPRARHREVHWRWIQNGVDKPIVIWFIDTPSVDDPVDTCSLEQQQPNSS